MAYAAVLPDPVLAFTRTSFPSRARGMDLAWEVSHAGAAVRTRTQLLEGRVVIQQLGSDAFVGLQLETTQVGRTHQVPLQPNGRPQPHNAAQRGH